jgi:RimJ/RimL family protein N-acetyltransferase
MIDKRYWRRGLAGEAARGIRDYAFDQLGLSRLICMIDGENAASIGVATAIGMTFEKEVTDEHGPYLIYSMARPAN